MKMPCEAPIRSRGRCRFNRKLSRGASICSVVKRVPRRKLSRGPDIRSAVVKQVPRQSVRRVSTGLESFFGPLDRACARARARALARACDRCCALCFRRTISCARCARVRARARARARRQSHGGCGAKKALLYTGAQLGGPEFYAYRCEVYNFSSGT